jgi:hypothetical protein
MFSFTRKPAGADHYEVLARIHDLLKPRTYVEIGIRKGLSFALAKTATASVGIDPAPELEMGTPPGARIFRMTSDAFFAQHDLAGELGGGVVDLAFIDGMHLFEFALRDFANLEKFCAPSSTILVHDCYPLDRATSTRERATQIWSGDVWKLIPCLKKYRPDLHISTVDVPHTGLGIIRGLDPKSTALASRLDQLNAEFIPLDYGVMDAAKAQQLNRLENNWHEIKAALSVPPPAAG